MEWNKLLNENRRRPSHKQPGEFRLEFERDYDRAVFSTPVRRLQDKAQVFPLEPHDAVRTRLTHSLEVSTVARDIAGKAAQTLVDKRLLTPEQQKQVSTIAATCGLIHDLGNPPFGHAGEQAISTWFRDRYENLDALAAEFKKDNTPVRAYQLASDFWHFEGNAQTLRLIAKLQVLIDVFGLNFTYGTLSAACKYLAASDQINPTIQHLKKPGYFASDVQLIEEIRSATDTGDARNPITYLVEASDDIVYTVVDIEDGLKKGVINWETVSNELRAANCDMVNKCLDDASSYVAKQATISLSHKDEEEAKTQYFRIFSISAMVTAVLKTFELRYDAIMDGSYNGELIQDEACEASCFAKACKGFARKHVYTSQETLRLELMGKHVIHDLMDIFWRGVSGTRDINSVAAFPNKTYGLMSNNYRLVFDQALASGLPERYCEMQLLTDYICGMTDTFACTLHKQLKNG